MPSDSAARAAIPSRRPASTRIEEAALERGRRWPAPLRRRQIADASLRIIAARGLGQFTAKAIARELGVTDAAIFRHLPTKYAIVEAAIERVEEVMFSELPDAANPVERLGQFFHQRIETIAGNPGIAQLMFSEDLARAGGEEGARRVADMKRRSIAFVRGCLEEAAAAGMLATGVTPRAATLMVTGALRAVTHAGPPQSEKRRVGPADELWPALGRLFSKTSSE